MPSNQLMDLQLGPRSQSGVTSCVITGTHFTFNSHSLQRFHFTDSPLLLSKPVLVHHPRVFGNPRRASPSKHRTNPALGVFLPLAAPSQPCTASGRPSHHRCQVGRSVFGEAIPATSAVLRSRSNRFSSLGVRTHLAFLHGGAGSLLNKLQKCVTEAYQPRWADSSGLPSG